MPLAARSSGSHGAAKAQVRSRGIDRLRLPCRRSGAEAVVRRTEVRAALDDAARDPLDCLFVNVERPVIGSTSSRRLAAGRSHPATRPSQPWRRRSISFVRQGVEVERECDHRDTLLRAGRVPKPCCLHKQRHELGSSSARSELRSRGPVNIETRPSASRGHASWGRSQYNSTPFESGSLRYRASLTP